MGKYAAAVHVYPAADYEHMRLFLTPDGKTGFALKEDAGKLDIVSAFKHPGATDVKKFANAALALAVQNGGETLDCFDTVLPKIYGNNGFKATGRLAWNDEYKPDDWNYETFKAFNNGRPDVVFMKFDPAHARPYEAGDGARVADYDAGKITQKAFDPDEPRDDQGRWSDGGGSEDSGGDNPTARFESLSGSKIDPKAEFGSHKDDREGVGMYAGLGNSIEVNRILRGQGESFPAYDKIISDLTSEIKVEPRLPQDVITYRYVGNDFADTLKPGIEYVDPAFVSTTIDRSVITKHRDIALYSHPGRIVTVRLPKGHQALAVKGSTEREIIVQRGSRFRVVNVNKRDLTIEALS